MNESEEMVVGPFTIRAALNNRREIWLTHDPSKRVRLLPYQLEQFLKKASRDLSEGRSPSLPDVRV